MDSRSHRFNVSIFADLGFAGLLTGLSALFLSSVFAPGPLFYGVVALLSALAAFLICWHWRRACDFGWANRTTLVRGVLVISLVSLAPFLEPRGNSLWLYGSLCLIALILDGVDGYIARATESETAFGARFDMELDALFILGLCVAVIALDKTGAWVLALGLMRYVFVALGAIWPFINRPLPESFRRKTACVWQVVTLMIAVLPVTPDALAFWSLLFALALLSYSFGSDLYWLYRRRRTS